MPFMVPMMMIVMTLGDKKEVIQRELLWQKWYQPEVNHKKYAFDSILTSNALLHLVLSPPYEFSENRLLDRNITCITLTILNHSMSLAMQGIQLIHNDHLFVQPANHALCV